MQLISLDIPDAHLLYNYAQSIDILDEEFMADPQSTTIPSKISNIVFK